MELLKDYQKVNVPVREFQILYNSLNLLVHLTSYPQIWLTTTVLQPLLIGLAYSLGLSGTELTGVTAMRSYSS